MISGEWHKVIVVGSVSVGKSSFILRKQKNVFEDTLTTKTISQVYVETTHYFENQRYDLRLFEYQNTGETSNFFLDAEAAIIIYSIHDPETYREVPSWVDQIRSYYSPSNQNFPIVICANKTDDIYMKKDVDFSKVQKRFNGASGVKCVETSAKNGQGIEDVFDQIVIAIKNRDPIISDAPRKSSTGNSLTGDTIESTPWLCCCFLFP